MQARSLKIFSSNLKNFSIQILSCEDQQKEIIFYLFPEH